MADTFDAMDPDRQLGYLVVRASEVVSRPWLRGLRAHGVNPRQFSVLAVIARDPGLSQAELARRAFITPQSMSELIAQLTRDRIVARRDMVRGQSTQVELTAKGRELLAAAYPVVAQLNRESFTMLDDDEQRTLAALLHKVITGRSDVPAVPESE